jgi:nucleoside-diphosphate-sugar epimerase
VLDSCKNHPDLTIVKGDIRNPELLDEIMPGCKAVIHLACISNDPSFELNPELGRSINLDAFEPLVRTARNSGVQRFIYASSSSVYGVKEEENVHEEMTLEPLTDYSRFKADCEGILKRFQAPGFCTCSIRPATVCGYSRRQRLDVIVNILTNHAYHNREIKIFGGEQKRPNIHIRDMVDVYLLLLEAPEEKIAGEVFNAGYENHRVKELAEMVREVMGPDSVRMVLKPTDDVRSYHISSEKIDRVLGFRSKHSIQEAASELVEAFEAGILPDAMTDSRYFNIKRMQEVKLW